MSETDVEWRDAAAPDPSRHHARSSWLFGRLLGLVFLIAFVSFHAQLDGLVGEHGITPANELMHALRARGLGFWDVPTVAWMLGASDGALETLCVVGELVSLALMVGLFPGLASLLASLFYLSLASVSGTFMAFQWDSLLVETGFLAALMLPWQPIHHARSAIEPPRFARWALHLLLFRLIFLSGMVKLRSGDRAWASLNALSYHYYTQPLPGPLSFFVHQLPSVVHRASTFAVVAIELALPFSMFFGARARRACFLGVAFLMTIIALTGNYGFFNVLTFALALPLLDDAVVDRLVGRRLGSRLRSSKNELPQWRRALRLSVAPIVAVLVIVGQLQILLGFGAAPALPSPALDAIEVAGRYRAVNGYGLFAVMTTERREIRIEGSLDGRSWREYRFAFKPGDRTALPRFSAPHMPRLDWQMWFAALGTWRDNPWLIRFMRRLLEARPEVLALLAHDPFAGEPPRYVRALAYDYRFGDFTLLWEEGAYWRVGEPAAFAPTLSRD